MGYIEREGRNQGTLFPQLDEKHLKSSFVKGHDFSHADKLNRINRASAPGLLRSLQLNFVSNLREHCSLCCKQAQKRSVSRHLYEDPLNRMQDRVTPAVMRLRQCTAEHPFATIKYRIFGHPRLVMRGLSGARVEIVSRRWQTSNA
jgi:hypothetical protein